MSSSISQRAARLQAQLRAAQAENGNAGRATSSAHNKQAGRPENAGSSWQWMGKSVRRYVGLGALVVSLLVVVVMATRTYRQLQGTYRWSVWGSGPKKLYTSLRLREQG